MLWVTCGVLSPVERESGVGELAAALRDGESAAPLRDVSARVMMLMLVAPRLPMVFGEA